MSVQVIHLINQVSDVVNNDADVGDLLKVIFIEDYNVSKCEIIVPASDISQVCSKSSFSAPRFARLTVSSIYPLLERRHRERRI